jgi:hypothetical protein
MGILKIVRRITDSSSQSSARSSNTMNDITPFIPYIIPFVLIDLGLIIYALIDLFQKDRQVKGNNKLIWALVILFISTFGSIIYLFFGREDI